MLGWIKEAPMKIFKYVVYQEGKYYVSQCLNVDISSFGKTIDEAVKNLEDAVQLYLRDDLQKEPSSFRDIGNTLVGEMTIHA
jgi:predicted RNase H-like HicB family nuclease